MTITTETQTRNKQLVRDYWERGNAGDLEGAGALLAIDCVNHAAVPEAQGRAGHHVILTKLRAAFPDLRFHVEDVLADGDKVVVRGTMTGTNQGRLAFARMPIEATGRAVRVEQIHIFRLADGLIVEHWAGRDDVGMFRQLGLTVVPAA